MTYGNAIEEAWILITGVPAERRQQTS